MKKKLVFGLLCLMSITTIVNAQTLVEPFASILVDGKLHINEGIPKDDDEYYSEVNDIVTDQYSNYLQDDEKIIDKKIYVESCAEDYSACTFTANYCLVGGECIETEPIELPIVWNSDVEVDTEPSEFYNKVVPNGVLKMNSIKPTNETEADFYVNSYFLQLYKDNPLNVSSYTDKCNDDYSKCKLSISIHKDDQTISEKHTVNIVWQPSDSKIKSMIDGYIKKIDALESEAFHIKDLNLINYLSHTSKYDNGTIINYSKTLSDAIENANVSLYVDERMGVAEPMYDSAFGGIVLYYNDIAYGVVEAGIVEKDILYIPDETKNTKEAYVAAATKRIHEYLGNKEAKVEVAGLRSEYISESGADCNFSELGDESKMGDYYYKITVGKVTKEFVIIRDSSKIEKTVLTTKDMETNIVVSTESSSLPLDTAIQVKEVKKDEEVFKNIEKLLNLETKEEVQVYDLKLFSKSTDNFVSKLETGEFKVSVPIKDSLKGKKLAAYYITDNNKIEVHPVTVVDGIATFTTTHFSVYTIGEVRDIDSSLLTNVPNTADGIVLDVILGIIGLIGLISAIVILKKKEI